MDIKYGKHIDISRLKKPVLNNLNDHLKKIQCIIEYLTNNEKSLKQDKCYICGANASTPAFEVYGFIYLVCDECGHYYTDKRFTEESISNFYKKNKYWAEITYANKETCQYRKENVAKPKVEFLEQYKDLSSGYWLDVGAGIGDLCSVVEEKGMHVTGLELSETSVSFGKDVFNIELVPKTMIEYNKSQPLESLDVISFIGLLEHVTDPIKHLKIAIHLLKNDGLVMIQVPNAESFASQIQSVFPTNIFRHMSPIEHIMVYTKKSLLKALEITGFEPIALWYHGLDMYELLCHLILLNAGLINSSLEKTFLTFNNEFQQSVDNLGLSDRIICIARKNII